MLERFGWGLLMIGIYCGMFVGIGWTYVTEGEAVTYTHSANVKEDDLWLWGLAGLGSHAVDCL